MRCAEWKALCLIDTSGLVVNNKRQVVGDFREETGGSSSQSLKRLEGL